MPTAPPVAATAAQQTTRETGSSALTEAVPPTTPPAFGAAYLNNPKPAYPPLARRLGEEGTVILRVKVTAQGQVESLHVQQSSGYEPLDAAALNAVRQWTFTPAQLAGKPQAGWVLVPIQFSLAR
jgi:protein TonB